MTRKILFFLRCDSNLGSKGYTTRLTRASRAFYTRILIGKMQKLILNKKTHLQHCLLANQRRLFSAGFLLADSSREPVMCVMDSCARVFFSVSVWTLLPVLAFQCLHGLVCLCFSVSVWNLSFVFLSVQVVWTLMLVLAFFSVCMDSCARVSQCFFVWTLVLTLAFLSVCMDSCAWVCVGRQCLHGLLCLCFSVLRGLLSFALMLASIAKTTQN